MTLNDFIKLSSTVTILVVNEDERFIDIVTVDKDEEIKIGKFLQDKLDKPIKEISASPVEPKVIYLTIKED